MNAAPTLSSILNWQHMQPEALLNCPDWVEKNIFLSRESGCADPGDFQISKMPHSRGPLESWSDPLCEEITLKYCAQAIKTTLIYCFLGYAIDNDPDPALVVLPKDGNEKSWRDIRFRLIIKDSPALARHITGKEDDLAGDIFQLKNTFIKFASAGSPSGLAETPCRYIILDEKNKYPPYSGREASPSLLAKERAERFYNRKYVNASTPTTKDGEISEDYEISDQRERYCQCPHCKEFQILTFFKKEDGSTGRIVWPDGIASDEVRNAQSAWYECKNECIIEENEHWAMIMTGVDVQKGSTIDKDGVVSGKYYSRHHGYKVWRIHTGLRTFSDIASEFLKWQGNPGKLMNFYNSWLCEEWEENPAQKIDSLALADRREEYGPELPDGVLYLTAWFDTQDNRLEGEIIGWGIEEECWAIEYIVIAGSPGEPATWAALDEFLSKKYITVNGVPMAISGAGVDTQGHHFKDVCNYCRPRHQRVNGPRVFATQGASIPANKPLKRLVMEPTRNNTARVPLYNIDTSSFKQMIFKRLKDFDQHGPKYMHFPIQYDNEYFRGLVESESLKRIINKQGYRKTEWVRDTSVRNEPLDIRVGNMAVLFIMNPNFAKLKESMERLIADQRAGLRPQLQRRGARIISKGVVL